jgi:hypothetical protein
VGGFDLYCVDGHALNDGVYLDPCCVCCFGLRCVGGLDRHYVSGFDLHYVSDFDSHYASGFDLPCVGAIDLPTRYRCHELVTQATWFEVCCLCASNDVAKSA